MMALLLIALLILPLLAVVVDLFVKRLGTDAASDEFPELRVTIQPR
jgi:hypothetical protein